MIILKQNLYSSKKKKSEKKDKSKDVDNTDRNIGRGLVIGSLIGNTAAGMEFLYNPKKLENSKELSKKLIKLAKENNIKIQYKDKLPAGSPAAYSSRSDSVLIKKGAVIDADVLSHELGHRHYLKDKSAKKLGKISHKLYLSMPTKIGKSILNPAISIGSGIKKAKDEKKGEKESNLNKILPYATSVGSDIPMLTSELKASKKGLELLKKSGASAKDIKVAKRNLGLAFGTYATLSAMKAGKNALIKHAAYKRTKKKLDKDNDSNN